MLAASWAFAESQPNFRAAWSLVRISDSPLVVAGDGMPSRAYLSVRAFSEHRSTQHDALSVQPHDVTATEAAKPKDSFVRPCT